MNSYLLKQTIMVTEMQAYHRNTFFFSTFDNILWQTKMESCSKLEWMLDLTDESKPQTSSEICWILLLIKQYLVPVTIKNQHISHTIQLLKKI